MRTVLGVLLRFCRLWTVSLLMLLRAAPVALISFALLLPAYAQYWGDPWSGRQQQRQQQYNPFGSFWGDRSGGFWGQREAPRYPRQRERAREPEREQPPDYSRAPSATPRKDATNNANGGLVWIKKAAAITASATGNLRAETGAVQFHRRNLRALPADSLEYFGDT